MQQPIQGFLFVLKSEAQLRRDQADGMLLQALFSRKLLLLPVLKGVHEYNRQQYIHVYESQSSRIDSEMVFAYLRLACFNSGNESTVEGLSLVGRAAWN